MVVVVLVVMVALVVVLLMFMMMMILCQAYSLGERRLTPRLIIPQITLSTAPTCWAPKFLPLAHAHNVH